MKAKVVKKVVPAPAPKPAPKHVCPVVITPYPPHVLELIDHAIKTVRGTSRLSDEYRHRQIGEALARGVVPAAIPEFVPPSPSARYRRR